MALAVPATLSKFFARKHRRSAQVLCSQKHESTACWPQILPRCHPPAVPSCVTWTEVLCFFMVRKVFLGSVCSHVAHSHPPYTSCLGAGSHFAMETFGLCRKDRLQFKSDYSLCQLCAHNQLLHLLLSPSFVKWEQ